MTTIFTTPSEYQFISYTNKYIITEYCNGDLDSLFRDKELEKEVFYSILFQILCAIYFLQTIGIVHLDLKYRNIFYKYTQEEYISYKILSYKEFYNYFFFKI